MKGRIARLVKSVGLTLWIALALVLISGFHQAGFYVLGQSHMMPCFMGVVEVPENITAYGFPFSWIAIVKGVEEIGCGPVVGGFAKTSFYSAGLAMNWALYSLVCSPLGMVANRKLWKERKG